MVLPRIAHRNPVSYYRMLWTAARYSLSRSPQPLQTRRFSLPVPLLFPYLFLASYIRGKLHPADGYNANGRGLSATGFMHLSIPIYPFAQEQCFLFPWINVHWPGRMMRAVLSHRFPTFRINTRFSIRRSNEIMTPLSTGDNWLGEVLYIYRSNFLFLLYIRTFAYSLKLLYQRTFTFILSYQTSNVECPPYFS